MVSNIQSSRFTPPNRRSLAALSLTMACSLAIAACAGQASKSTPETPVGSAVIVTPAAAPNEGFLSAPLVSHIYTADPSAHSWHGKIYVYPSHDVENDKPLDSADKFDMRDYHVFSMDAVGGPITDHGAALHIDDVPWAKAQMWAPDAAQKDGKYYLYFPAKDANGIFRIGAAVADNPTGPFTPEPEPIQGTYSIDPAVYEDDDGSYYLYLGGIWGGQLQHWDTDGNWIEKEQYPAASEPALPPRVAKLADDMVSLAEPLKPIEILDESGQPLSAGDVERRFFEAAWVHKREGIYYLSYSTGETHFIQYATSDSPYGPFTYQGVVLKPVLGWTNHHSIVEHDGKWFIFYHDSELSDGITHLRNIKVAELKYDQEGKIIPIDPLPKTTP